jgi:hypothetical protein
MRVPFKAATLAAAAVAATAIGAFSASAAIVDFTASASTSGTVAGANWTLASNGGPLTFVDVDAPGPLGPLAGLNDGVGVGNDEITIGSEFVTVTFDRKVRLITYFVLDLFDDGPPVTDNESAILYAGASPMPGSFVAELIASEPFAIGGFGFGQLGVDVVGTTFTFAAGNGNDGVGSADFALAGLEIAAIPVPASGLLIGTALLGLGLARRRR